MPKIINAIAVGLLVSMVSIISPCASAAKAAPVENFQKTMDRLVTHSRIKKSHLGLVVTRVANGKILASLNKSSRMTPASLTKIVTAAAILEKMPVGHQFETDLLTTAPEKNGVLNGAIYLRGGGDPGFVSESMWCLVNEFLRTGIKTIRGDIIVDDTLFDKVRFDPSRDQTLVDRAYDSPIGAMTFNWSAVNIFVRPGQTAGEPARVFSDPENEYIKIVDHATTSARGQTDIHVTNQDIYEERREQTRGAQNADANAHETIVVSGHIPKGAKEFVAYKSISRPAIWSGYQLKAFLHERGINVTGMIRTGKTPDGAKILAAQKSKSIEQLISEMMKYSNNFIAEILTKDLGVQEGGAPGTMQKGMAAIHGFLSELHLKSGDDYTMVSPSGLSRENSFRPIDLLHVLEHVRKRFQIYPEYAAALPIGGVDGTLRHWLKGSDLLGIVRAKSGHLDGVVGLGGFAGARDGEIYEFVFLFNGTAKESGRAATLFDSLVSELLKAG